MSRIVTGRRPYRKGAVQKVVAVRQDAAGRDCTLMIPGVCCHDPARTVGLHMRLFGFGGMGLKPDDIFILDGCDCCHAVLDSRDKWAEAALGWDDILRAFMVTLANRRAREVKLDWKGNAEELDRLYWLAQSGQHATQQAPARYSWRACIEAWRADSVKGAGRVADSTRASYRLPMDRIMEKNGGRDMRMTTRTAVRGALARLHDTPRKAARYAQTISLLWNYARRELDWPLGENPASGLAAYKPARPYEPWPDWLVAKLIDAPENLRLAAALILGTGQRPNAAISMRWDQFDGDWMEVTDEKSGTPFPVFCPSTLRDALARAPRRGDHVLARSLRAPVGYDAVEKAFRAWRKGFGDRAEKYTLHGLRKLAIVELAEAGATDAEIQAVTGQSAEMVAYYRAQANRKHLSKTAQERRTRT